MAFSASTVNNAHGDAAGLYLNAADNASCLYSAAATTTTTPATTTTTTTTTWLQSFYNDFKWQNTLFVSFSTTFSTFIFLSIIYYWWANRQFHFTKRPKDGSRLSQLATHEDALRLNALKKKNEKAQRGRENDTDIDDHSTATLGIDDDEEESEHDDEEEEVDLSDYETDDDDDDKNNNKHETSPEANAEKTRMNNERKNWDFLQQFPPEKRRAVRDLTRVVANMEVFSYLSPEAFVQCLEYMEYVDLPRGQVLFEQESYDGSLYAVVSGRVQCQFEFLNHNNSNNKKHHRDFGTSCSMNSDESEVDEDESFISFTAGDGDVVTSLLSVLAGLVRQCQERGHKRDKTNVRNDENDFYKLTRIIPAGISVVAIGVAENTKLVKVPPQCFLQMLDKFPRDVHRISQTIIARMQRVVLQTVVRCLGLQKEIVQRNNNSHNNGMSGGSSSSSAMDHVDQIMTRYRPEAWLRFKAALSNNHLSPAHASAISPSVKQQVEQDAALVAAVNLMGPNISSLESPAMTGLIQKLQQVGRLVSLSPGQTLFENGEALDSIYIILQGTLDVGISNSPSEAASTAPIRQSTRRASIRKDRRHIIFPQNAPSTSSALTGLPKSVPPMRRRHASKGSSTSSATAKRSTNAVTPSTSFSRMYKATMGEVMGILSCFTGDVSAITARNSSEWETVLLYKIPKADYDALLAEQPTALTECLGSILNRLCSSIVCLLDWNVEWMHVQAGEDVVHRGDECDAMYAVLNGRLRAALPYTAAGAGAGGFNPSSRKSNLETMPPRVPPPPQQQPMVRNTSEDSFLSRASQRLRNRRSLFKFVKVSKPKVASEPPPLSRRIMNSAGEEVQGEEFGRGSIIGEVEILTGADWSADVYASRHSELARVPVPVLNCIIRMFPQAGLHLARVVASQIRRKDARKKNIMESATSGPLLHIDTGRSTSVSAPSLGNVEGVGRSILPSYDLNLSTIAIVPLLEGDFDIDGFSSTLQQTLQTIAPTKLMTKAFARERLGEEIFRQRNAMHGLKMTRLCGDMEENYRIVVYQAESSYTWWTRLCIQQADCILLVVRSEKAPPQKKVEACLSWAFTALNVKIQLVVLQASTNNKDREVDDKEDDTIYETMDSSDQLNDWSEARYWIAGHHLVRMPFKKHVLDFRRLCRRVTGRSIGVVFGGGGARGLAHIGVIKALMEAGITVDFVGGTSQGAYIGALFAMQPDDFPSIVRAARKMSISMSDNWEKLCDLTLPLVSFFSGYRFNRGIQKSLGRRRIQDLVCNFFCVSTDIRNNVQVVHTKGVCWRYVRASMTLQNYLPPLSEDGTLLVDGGYMNFLPADVMKRQMRARTVIAVDVSQEVILDNYEYGSHLNGFWILWNSWNPFTKTVNIPSMGDISERLAWVCGEQHKKKVREHIDLFLQPPVGNFGVLEYDKFDEIVKLGYEYAKPRVDAFVAKYPHLVS